MTEAESYFFTSSVINIKGVNGELTSDSYTLRGLITKSMGAVLQVDLEIQEIF